MFIYLSNAYIALPLMTNITFYHGDFSRWKYICFIFSFSFIQGIIYVHK